MDESFALPGIRRRKRVQLRGMRFEIPSNATTLQVQWYGNEVGNPGSLNVTIFGDKNGALDPPKNLQARMRITRPSPIPPVGRVEFRATGSFSAGYYWIKFSSPSSDKSNYYTVY